MNSNCRNGVCELVRGVDWRIGTVIVVDDDAFVIGVDAARGTVVEVLIMRVVVGRWVVYVGAC